MKTTYRNTDTQRLLKIANILLTEGFEVSDVVVPSAWDEPAYFHTNASNRDVLAAWRAA